ncbi:MAG TPA: YcnI family protein [Streptosporangiaceae bacterium]|nr:YcnI family protein [Streptosporangiaceae bacterium]
MSRTGRTRRPAVRALSRTAVAVSAAAAGVVLLAVPALAHITVTPNSAPAGSAAVLTFHVPNEQPTADTVKVDMQIPTAHPIVSLLVKPVAGWTISVKTINLAKPVVTDDGKFTQAVSEIIWSGGKIAPGQFQDFEVSADPLPSGVSSVAFKAIQTYSNGVVVPWIDMPVPGQPEPAHPAPILTLTKGTANPQTAALTDKPASSATASSGSGSDGTARVLGIAGVAVALLALATAGLRRRRDSGG